MLGQVYSSAIVESVLVPHSKDVCILSVNLKKAWNEKSYGFDRWKWLQKVWLWKQPCSFWWIQRKNKCWICKRSAMKLQRKQVYPNSLWKKSMRKSNAVRNAKNSRWHKCDCIRIDRFKLPYLIIFDLVLAKSYCLPPEQYIYKYFSEDWFLRCWMEFRTYKWVTQRKLNRISSAR